MSKNTLSISIPLCTYAGIVAGKPGKPDYHLSLLAGTITNATWEDSSVFAAGLGGGLPTREEMPLIGKLHDEIVSGPYWTADRDGTDRALAFCFSSGVEGYSHTSREFIGRAVRRDLVQPQDDGVVAPAVVLAVAEPADGAAALIDAELWPDDRELVDEIRAMFLVNWGMDGAQADARMSRLNYTSKNITLPVEHSSVIFIALHEQLGITGQCISEATAIGAPLEKFQERADQIDAALAALHAARAASMRSIAA